MRSALVLHPVSRCTAVTGIDVEVSRPRPGSLVLHYALSGSLTDLRLPPAATPVRGDDLWRHTCFEAFIRAAPGAAYYELNFAPSRHWAAYRFGGYRSGMSVAQDIGAPRLEAGSSGERFGLQAELDLDEVRDLPGTAAWRLGLSAVIEDAEGGLSYWALAHPPGKPDFHHSDCFALELPVALRP